MIQILDNKVFIDGVEIQFGSNKEAQDFLVKYMLALKGEN